LSGTLLAEISSFSSKVDPVKREMQAATSELETYLTERPIPLTVRVAAEVFLSIFFPTCILMKARCVHDS